MPIWWAQMDQDDPRPVPAVAYVRMSTEHQQYSTDHQIIAINQYADSRGYQILRIYADEGKSGLTLAGRPELQRLLADVEDGNAACRAILVYDVSRLGRFQDTDEAAAYELRCRRAGVVIHYCAEQFENDGSIGSTIIKTVKRAMAGEYSRELSVKVFNGQAHLARLGYRQGGRPGFGLRRLVVDRDGAPKGELKPGEQKSIATDRVILAPGPPAEVAIVREVYRLFLAGSSELEIARLLNKRGITAELAHSWNSHLISQILTNEKYIGNHLWGRLDRKLKKRMVRVAPEGWIRADGAFAPIVEREIFDRALARIRARKEQRETEHMIEQLSLLLQRQGTLSPKIIDACPGCPSSSSYRKRFGTLNQAYRLIGFRPSKRDFRFIETNHRLRALHPLVLAEVIDGIRQVGGEVRLDADIGLLTVNGEFSASLLIARCAQTGPGTPLWEVRLDRRTRPDILLVVRMDATNAAAIDYYVLPRSATPNDTLRLREQNRPPLDAFRCQTLEPFYRLAARQPMRSAVNGDTTAPESRMDPDRPDYGPQSSAA